MFSRIQQGRSRRRNRTRKSDSNRRRRPMHVDSSFARSRKNTISIFVCSFLLSFVFATTSRAQSEVFTKWVARFDAAHAFDQPFAMAVDGKGNTFLTRHTCLP